MQVAMKKRNRILLPHFPYPSWVRVKQCANGAPRASALVADSIICKLLPPFPPKHGYWSLCFGTSRQVGGKLIDRKTNPNMGFIMRSNLCPTWSQVRKRNCLHFWRSDSIAPPQRERHSKKNNRTVFFGQLSGWLFFCRSERSKCIAPSADGNGTIMENKT